MSRVCQDRLQRDSPLLLLQSFLSAGTPVVTVLSAGQAQQVRQRHSEVLEGVKQEHAKDDGPEPAQGPHHVLDRVLQHLPLLEENGRSYDGEGGEHHIVYWCDDGGVENVQRLVQVVHLDGDACGHGNQEEPGEGVCELAHSGEGELDGYAQALAGHDGERADEGADGNVDQDVCLSILWSYHKDEVDGEAD